MTPTQDQVVKALPHVRYEIEALLLTPEYDSSNRELEESVFFRKMAHGRALYSFFSRAASERREDDILSVDFDFGPELPYGKKPKPTLDRFNKRLFHLTYARTSVADEWLMDKLLLPVMRLSRRFIDHMLLCRTIPIDEAERSRWRDLKARDAGRLPLQQNTSNVATYQIQALELDRGT